jgi:hypothetical protein
VQRAACSRGEVAANSGAVVEVEVGEGETDRQTDRACLLRYDAMLLR